MAGAADRRRDVVLVDTSVWIEVFRRPSRLNLSAVTDLEEVVTCLPVVQEVLQGFDAFAEQPSALIRLGRAKPPQASLRRSVALVTSFRNS